MPKTIVSQVDVTFITYANGLVAQGAQVYIGKTLYGTFPQDNLEPSKLYTFKCPTKNSKTVKPSGDYVRIVPVGGHELTWFAPIV